MSRVRFLKIKQSDFLNKTKQKIRLDWPDIAKVCKVHNRTLFDWRRDKYQMSYESPRRLSERYHLSILRKVKILSDTWNIRNAARLGAIRRNELYGSPGTPEGRRKGGFTTWKRYKDNPKDFEGTNFNGPKKINYPAKSSRLSELIGIILGDGSITEYQVRVSLNNKTDKEYMNFVSGLFKRLFKVKVVFAIRKKNACDLVISSVKLVEYLVKLGLKRGDKIRNQISIPKWVLSDKNYMIACLRGLIDTDGGVYYHNHVTKGIRYLHLELGLTSHSFPLLKGAHDIFLDLKFPAKLNYRGHIFIYDRNAIGRYFKEIGTHNTHHLQRYKDYLDFLGRGARAVYSARLESV